MEMDHPTTFAFGVPGKAAAVDRTIPIKARDVSFDVESVNVKAGETVRFVITNEGAADHEFTLGDAATQAEHRQEMLDMADMDASHAHDGDANAVFLKSGETKELVWAFTKTGLIEFACNVPGHYEAGMKGIIAVQ
ncbi:MAG: plastocyanin/azurin family copper-binding protein [Ancalomicrobiaceae bacterium]|nr:plastocyanin/azurin family copper-binding protein [Ancalomicrobiaceae bacterium]